MLILEGWISLQKAYFEAKIRGICQFLVKNCRSFLTDCKILNFLDCRSFEILRFFFLSILLNCIDQRIKVYISRLLDMYSTWICWICTVHVYVTAFCNLSNYVLQMSHVMRKPVYAIPMRTTKVQISLRIRTVWSSPLLFAAQIV